jgi:two-component system, OmpR family, phosphate regulon response regulator PhoB
VTQHRILIIEDEKGLARALSWYFEHQGYGVSVAYDGEEGLQKARDTLPDVILLDLMLPRMHGLDVCCELRAGERTGQIPVIIMSARSEELDQIMGYAAGANDYVPKPLSNERLLAKVKTLITRRG